MLLNQSINGMMERSDRVRFHYCPRSSLDSIVAEKIRLAAQKAIDHCGEFHIVLAGGGTPRRIYQRFVGFPDQWSCWHIYFGDERCLKIGDSDRNSQMVKEAWLDSVAIPPEQIHIIPAQKGAEVAAASYAKLLQGIPVFDMVLLGLGEDGHTASLFPANSWGVSKGADPAVLPVFDAPKPPAERVSLAAYRLAQAHQVAFIVSGDSKRDALIRWQRGDSIPAAAICPDDGVDVYFDTVID